MQCGTLCGESMTPLRLQRLVRASALGWRWSGARAAWPSELPTALCHAQTALPHTHGCSSLPALRTFSKQRGGGVAAKAAKKAQAATSDDEQAAKVEGDATERMGKAMEATKQNFASVRTGRANPSMLDRIQVEYYGTMSPLKALAGISVPEPRTLLITPYDKSTTKAIEKAIIDSDVGITPTGDSGAIRLIIPQLTTDRRKELAKVVSQLGEEGKVKIRNVRRDVLKVVAGLEKDKKVSEDEQKALEAAVQKLTDRHVKELSDLVKAKQDEVMKV